MIEITPAVERVLDAARAFAAECGSAVVLPAHLLHTLMSDESRAHAILTAAGYSLADLHREFPAQRSGAPYEPAAAIDARVCDAALAQARRWLRDSPGETEIHTEHLLAALAATNTDVAALFDRLGLTPDRVRGAASSAAHEPVVIDEPPTAVAGQRSESEGRHPDVLRILDAAANRAREGLRVVEDTARFLLNDAHLCGLLKSLRHELVAALARLGSEMFHVNRDTAGDVGTAITTPGEQSRATANDVVRANCKRVEESLRSLEEYGKLIDPAAAATIEQLRYRFYTVEKALLTTEASRARLADCRLYLLVTENACRGGFEHVVKGALDGGVDAIQLREKDIDDRQLLALAAQVRAWTTAAGALFIMNDRPDLAALSGADGVHVGQDDLTVQQARLVLGPELLIGVSTHTIEQARQAVLDGADYLGVGPTFPSQTKQFDSFAGLEFVRAVAGEIGLPWFAIGGIDATNIAEVADAGATRVAVSSAICAADHPASMARELRVNL